MTEVQEFLKECKEVRNDFVAIAGLYTVDEHLVLRTEIDTLLIMYDQLCERVRGADIIGLQNFVVDTCALCGSSNLFKFKLEHIKCRDCNAQFEK